jgi:NAD(P)H-hydrate epimerase
MAKDGAPHTRSEITAHPELAVLTGQEMRSAEQAAFARGLPSFEAMRRAGRAVAELIARRWPPGALNSILVLCGPGNNGGDGFIIAAALQAGGYPVQVQAIGNAGTRSGDAQQAFAGWNGETSGLDAAAAAKLGARDLVVDALFGIGLTRPLTGDVRAVVEAVNRSGARVVAVDVPSGIDADSGAVPGAAIRADVTVTFGWAKRGHLLLPAAAQCGDVVVADIGCTADDLADLTIATFRNAPALWRDDYPRPRPEDHKYKRGHVVMAGGGQMTGAARLAARAARRVGIGMLTLAVPPAAWPVYAADQAGAIVKPAVDRADVLALAREDRVTALLAGSGLAPDSETAGLVRGCLAVGRPLVIDGGGLTALAQHGGLKGGRPDVVLTPHEGEFARLFPDLSAGGKLERARAAASLSGCALILKGADTVIAVPDGRAVLCDLGPANLATAGSGDVLAGVVAGLLGLGLAPLQAAAMAVWLHSAAARRVGLGLIAEDLPDLLPVVLGAALNEALG